MRRSLNSLHLNLTHMWVKVGICGIPRRGGLDVAETQETFYDLVSEERLRNWANRVPEFTVKALQVITHSATSPTYRRMRRFKGNPDNFGEFKVNEDTVKALEATLEEARKLGARLIVFQTPNSFTFQRGKDRVAQFWSILSRNFTYCWEPRGWSEEEVTYVLQRTGFIHAVDPFRNRSLSTLKYYRLHGLVMYRYEFTSEDFIKLRGMLGEENYVMFNNLTALRDALKFKELLVNTGGHLAGSFP